MSKIKLFKYLLKNGKFQKIKLIEDIKKLNNNKCNKDDFADLFKYIDVLFQKLDLEQKSIQAIANYNLAKAKIAQLTGELQ